MKNESSTTNTKDFKKDIATIKSLLMEVEEKPLIDIWAFFSWGGLFIAGAVIHLILYRVFNFEINSILLRVWTPIMLINMMLETIAMVKRMTRESIPFFSRSMIKFIMTGVGMFIGLAFITFILIKLGGITYLGTITLILFGVFILLYAQTVNFHLYFYSYFLMFSGIILYFINLTIHIQSILTGLILGIVLIIAGINLMIDEKKKTGDRQLLYTQFDNIFFEKTRLSIMTIIYKEELVSFNRLKNIIGGTDGAIYTHLKKLQEAKYIAPKKSITGSKMQTFYYLTKQGRKLFLDYLDFLEEVVAGKKEKGSKK